MNVRETIRFTSAIKEREQSPVLFNVMINDIFSTVGGGFGLSLFADDGATWKRGCNVNFMVKKMQAALNKVVEWAERWGFKISLDKSKFLVFGNKRKVGPLSLNMYGKELERVKVFKFLGVHFDERLTWKTHICKVVSKCEKIINVLRCLAWNNWGADKRTHLMIYQAMIRSSIDYGCLAYGSADRSNLCRNDVVQAKIMRTCSGAVRTSPISAPQVEYGEVPLNLRRVKLALQYIGRVQFQVQSNPVRCLLEESWETTGKGIRSFVNKIRSEFPDLGNDISPRVVWPCAPRWLLPDPHIDWAVKERIKKKGKGSSMCVVTKVINEKWSDFLQIYTDGSVDPNSKKAAFAVHIPDVGLKQGYRVPDCVSVFTTEPIAILYALEWVGKIWP